MGSIKVDDSVAKKYQDYYKDGDSEWRWLCSKNKADNIMDLCAGFDFQSVLEVGAGDGSILKRLDDQKFSETLYAIDISQSGVETVRSRNIPSLKECKLFDGYSIPYSDQQFDLVILSHVIEHVEHPRQLISEAIRVAKKLYIEVPLEDNSRLPEDYQPDAVGHINFFSPKTIRRLLQTCGLTIHQERVTNPSKDTYVFQQGTKGLLRYLIKESLLRIAPRFATRHFCYHYSAICSPSTL